MSIDLKIFIGIRFVSYSNPNCEIKKVFMMRILPLSVKSLVFQILIQFLIFFILDIQTAFSSILYPWCIPSVLTLSLVHYISLYSGIFFSFHEPIYRPIVLCLWILAPEAFSYLLIVLKHSVIDSSVELNNWVSSTNAFNFTSSLRIETELILVNGKPIMLLFFRIAHASGSACSI